MEERTYNELVVQKGLTEEFIGSKRETMLKLIDYVKSQYGEVDQYLTEAGFDNAWQDKLRSLLLDENIGTEKSDGTEKSGGTDQSEAAKE